MGLTGIMSTVTDLWKRPKDDEPDVEAETDQDPDLGMTMGYDGVFTLYGTGNRIARFGEEHERACLEAPARGEDPPPDPDEPASGWL
ncbi:MAG: hypothetical protein OXU45_04785 [Candidatus Melainabacteria bacterium]|nr:hypothetical protein [Candidatus Melainabacteria bacterium]